MVKADGYGHGATRRARGAAGTNWLAVATADEAAALRADGIGGRILVMGAIVDARRRSLDATVWDLEFLRAIAPPGRACT